MSSKLLKNQLHIYNIANVAYGYCKIINAKELEAATLLCHDTNHIMSQPEWDDQELDPSFFPDEGDFFNSTKMICYTRPIWYIRDDISFSTSRIVPVIAKKLPVGFKKFILPGFLVARKITSEIIAFWKKDKFDKLSKLDMAAQIFQPHVDWLKRHVQGKSICFAYATAPIYCYLYHDRPYVAVEIGTMRDIPFEPTTRGQLLSLAYKEADHIIITNPDVLKQARQLDLTRYTFCPHPVDEDKFFPQYDLDFRQKLLSDLGDAEFVGVAPARQNWEIKGNDKYIKALNKLRCELGLKVSIIVPTWGQDIDRSKRLAVELGVNQYIRWVAPLPESELRRYYSNVDFVLDQFNLGVFGLITPKALACGATVITSYDQELHNWCFSEHPPIMSARNEEEIVRRIVEVCGKDMKLENSRKSRDWFMRFHSKSVVLDILQDVSSKAERHFSHSGLVKRFGMYTPRFGSPKVD